MKKGHQTKFFNICLRLKHIILKMVKKIKRFLSKYEHFYSKLSRQLTFKFNLLTRRTIFLVKMNFY